VHLICLVSFCSLNEEGDGELFSTWDEVAESFDAMGLHENLLRGIYAYGEPIYVGGRFIEHHFLLIAVACR
jgi:hypothetical protein